MAAMAPADRTILLSFYLPGFHPWKHDDRPLIGAVERQLAIADTRSDEARA